MSTPEPDPVTAADEEAEPDFADEHARPSAADEQSGTADTRPDESTPAGEGGMDPTRA
ncbi:hypothetical protein [Saccharothrix syringae]|uniref:hypothetical protein n=1 Tax=Saccharothrix syringae TaxID=103733 RepID=UPI00129353FA|nr:hypothetical protein [Saccharothrix syringae]